MHIMLTSECTWQGFCDALLHITMPVNMSFRYDPLSGHAVVSISLEESSAHCAFEFD